MEWVPTVINEAVVRAPVDVLLPMPISEALPMVVAPSLKVTVPVGLPEPEPPCLLTVAVKVTFWPEQDGFLLEAKVVVEVASVNVVCAVTPDDWPVAVNSSVA